MFNQKEVGLLSDLKAQEKICVEKYQKYAQEAADPQLKGLFNAIGQTEQQHWDTLNGMVQGNIPTQQSLQQGQQNQQQNTQSSQPPTYGMAMQSPQKQADKYLCGDALSTEKHVSAEYNTCIFEFKDTNVRDALNHIQKEEQEHGQEIYGYMARNGMYQQ